MSLNIEAPFAEVALKAVEKLVHFFEAGSKPDVVAQLVYLFQSFCLLGAVRLQSGYAL